MRAPETTKAVTTHVVVRFDGVQVDGSEADDVTRKAIERNSGRLKACVLLARRSGTTLEGIISARWTITEGRVSGVVVTSSADGDADFRSCLTRTIHQFKFDSELSANVTNAQWRVE